MDPLSALQFDVSPEVRAARFPKAEASGVGRAIPASELERLTGATGPDATQAANPAATSFENTLGKMVSDVSGKQAAANEAVAGLLGGENVSLHQTMIAMEEASVSFQLMVEVRNKLLESYQELMRMQI